jgi:hypothetical protein
MEDFMKLMKAFIFGVFFTAISFCGFSLEFDQWNKLQHKDKFGDIIEEYSIHYSTKGTWKNTKGIKSEQNVDLSYATQDGIPVVVVTILAPMDDVAVPLTRDNMYVTLYIKNSNEKTYQFSGMVLEAKTTLSIIFINSPELVSLLKRKDSYKAVLDGNLRHWDCSFTFNGEMPE